MSNQPNIVSSPYVPSYSYDFHLLPLPTIQLHHQAHGKLLSFCTDSDKISATSVSGGGNSVELINKSEMFIAKKIHQEVPQGLARPTSSVTTFVPDIELDTREKPATKIPVKDRKNIVAAQRKNGSRTKSKPYENKEEWRAAATQRERMRAHNLNDAIKRLGQVLPPPVLKGKFTKLATIEMALAYIQALEAFVDWSKFD